MDSDQGGETLTVIEATLFNMASELDKTQRDATNYMCSQYCPCYDNGKSYAEYDKYDEATYNSFGRTKVGMDKIQTQESLIADYKEEQKKKLEKENA